MAKKLHPHKIVSTYISVWWYSSFIVKANTRNANHARTTPCPRHAMITSSNENIFRVTGHLCGEFTGPSEFPAQRPVTRSFDVFFDLRLNKRLSKQPWGWWSETLSCPLWRHFNDFDCWRVVLETPNRVWRAENSSLCRASNTSSRNDMESALIINFYFTRICIDHQCIYFWRTTKLTETFAGFYFSQCVWRSAGFSKYFQSIFTSTFNHNHVDQAYQYHLIVFSYRYLKYIEFVQDGRSLSIEHTINVEDGCDLILHEGFHRTSGTDAYIPHHPILVQVTSRMM